MKPEKRPIVKKARIRKAKVVATGQTVVFDDEYLKIRKKELNFIAWMKVKYLSFGIIIGVGFGYGIRNLLTWF